MTAASPTPHSDPETVVRELPARWFRTDLLTALGLIGLGTGLAALWNLTDMMTSEAFPVPEAMWFSVVLLGLPLIWRRRYPVVTGVALGVIYLVLGEFLALELYSSQIMLYLGFYSMGAWGANRKAVKYGRVVVLTIMAAWLIIFSAETVGQANLLGASAPSSAEMFAVVVIQWILNVIFFGAGWYFGDQAWASAVGSQQLVQAHENLRQAQETIADQAVQAERMHIARELHDVIAHHVTVMGIHASAARRLLQASTGFKDTTDDDGPAGSNTSPQNTTDPQVVEHVEHIEQASQQAVNELQSLVYTLRDQESSTQALPTLERLPDLVAQAQDSGQRVEFELIGEPVEVGGPIGLTLYRVAQEGLSNARKHAGSQAEVQVRLRYNRASVELEVSDNGRALPTRSDRVGTGTGVTGMRERLAAVGGSLQVGKKSRGGWLVRATVPLADQENISTPALHRM